MGFEIAMNGGVWYNEKNVEMQQMEGKQMELERHIFLIGFMGAGKSANAECLAELTGSGRLEMDQEIVKEQQMEIAKIFEKYGEPHFRDLETEFIRRLKHAAPAIVSCGGGAVLREENVRLMKEMGRIILLTATPQTILSRVKDSEERPILNGHKDVAYIETLLEKRRAMYESAADLSVSTDDREVEEICREILTRLEKS